MTKIEALLIGAPIVVILLLVWISSSMWLTDKVYKMDDKNYLEYSAVKATLITFLFMWLEVAVPYGIYLLVR